ncbi:MAG: type II secretion system major pseudopilin GspG [Opitutales bacterium]|nr:type II secretion system major pseudopilin GspG [Opitutales bacterium]NRA27166.1 type II secretion system major pseudopilin GspG [Opitutales bacterium]
MNSLNSSHLKFNRKRGFTLVEIVLVLALIGILLGVLLQNTGNILGTSKEDGAKIWVDATVSVPLVRYNKDIGNYPSTEDGLKALVTAPSGKEGRWRGPYLDKIPEDPFGNPYQYAFPGKQNARSYDVWSMGADGKSGTADDIGNWSTE